MSTKNNKFFVKSYFFLWNIRNIPFIPKLIPIIIGIAGSITWIPNTAGYAVKYHLLTNTPKSVTVKCGIPQ